MLAEQVGAVIGVETHMHTHTAAVVAAATGAVLAETTVPADPAGYQALVGLAERHGPLRACWSSWSGSWFGAGLLVGAGVYRARRRCMASSTGQQTDQNSAHAHLLIATRYLQKMTDLRSVLEAQPPHPSATSGA